MVGVRGGIMGEVMEVVEVVEVVEVGTEVVR